MNNIAVIIPVFNAVKTLRECIESVLGQSIKPRRIILIDDGSTDASIEIAREFKNITIISQQNLGVAAAMNQGLRHAKSDFFAFIDADDIWMSRCLEIQMTTLIANPNAIGVVGCVEEFICPNLSAQESMRFDPRPIQEAWLCGSTIVRRRIYDEIGGLNVQLSIGAWIDWIDRARLSGKLFTTHQNIILKRRLHPDSLSIRRKKFARDGMLDVVRLALERRRNLNE
jgi:glycosyltransferase involved in cell wall biosynthesis